MHHSKRHSKQGTFTLTILLLALLCAVVQTGTEGAAEPAPSHLDSGTLRDYMKSFAYEVYNTRCPWFHTNEYIRVRFHAYRSVQLGPREVGQPNGEKTLLSFHRGVMIEGREHNRTHIYNMTLSDPFSHVLELERVPLGTYRYTMIVEFADGKSVEVGSSVEVRHTPLEYEITTSDLEKRHIKFRPKDKGTYTLEIRSDYNTQAERTEIMTVNGTTSINVEDPSIVATRITVRDPYGWVNSHDEGRDFVASHVLPDFWVFMPFVAGAFVIVLLLLVLTIYRFSIYRLTKKREGWKL